LIIDGEVVWKIEEELPTWIEQREGGKMRDGTKVLQSDMMNRFDIPFMLTKDWEESEKYKVEMEEL